MIIYIHLFHAATPQTEEKRMIAIFDYVQRSEDELSFTKGQILHVVLKEPNDE